MDLLVSVMARLLAIDSEYEMAHQKEYLKERKMGSVNILELNTTEERFNTKSLSDITLSCPMDFAKFPFDDQTCFSR